MRSLSQVMSSLQLGILSFGAEDAAVFLRRDPGIRKVSELLADAYLQGWSG
jgi:hypothetical protein